MATFKGTVEGSRRGGPGYLPKQEGEISFPYDRTALLVIDPVNDLLSEGGAGWDMTKKTVTMNNVIGHLKGAIEGARRCGIPVIFGPMAYTEEDYTEGQLHRRSGINRLMYERRMFLAGSWGADFHHDLQPKDSEIVLEPHKGIDVFETDLPEHLERLGVTHLVICGMIANLCCESTGRRAMEGGYDVTFISDAIGASSIAAYEAAIHVNYPLIANAVITTDEFLAGFRSARGRRVDVQAGDRVFGSDHGEIGFVDEVYGDSGEMEAHLLIPRGIFTHHDLYIPLEAVVKRAGREVFINIPKAALIHMGWGKPPWRTARRRKLGPPGAAVERLYGSRSPGGTVTGF
ncbi:cysteine hydrolase [Geomonas sp. RF6]|uniref:cysteine hydrolase family protein n=1 Tax=Geomonas sp. RF6 TaxID=2897342 RepID=UPI001E52D8AD|nr:isochorismatase family cysteine hydrolase [Geomonas sp. RF6]UFS72549.1 cysteine hydrolase [Geomonas sp. RF6]